MLFAMARFAYSVIFVSDMDRSVRFYRDHVGLPFKFQSPDWSEFATEGCTLALHKAAKPALPAVGGSDLPAAHCHPGFQVPNLDEFHAHMTSLGVPCLREPRMEDFGVRMAVYADPDGLPVSVSDFPG